LFRSLRREKGLLRKPWGRGNRKIDYIREGKNDDQHALHLYISETGKEPVAS
jgi:hypothetical protein